MFMDRFTAIFLFLCTIVGFLYSTINGHLDAEEEGLCSGMNNFAWSESSSSLLQRGVENLLHLRHREHREPVFLFYARSRNRGPRYITNLNFTPWDIRSGAKTIFIVHGYKDADADWPKRMKDALLLGDDVNVFIVEWGQTKDTFEMTAKMAPAIGSEVALFIRHLMKSKMIRPKDVHLIGHSLGAHISGFAGKSIKMTHQKLIGRITGLDPAGPGFYDAPPELRLEAGDSSFVDVIHTNWACSRASGLRSLDPMLCSHKRSYEYFTSSIVNHGCQFLALRCPGWEKYESGRCHGNELVVMGYHAERYKDLANSKSSKTYYLRTTASPPYCV